MPVCRRGSAGRRRTLGLGLGLGRAARPRPGGGARPRTWGPPPSLCRAPHRARLPDAASSRMALSRSLGLGVPGRLAFWEDNPPSRGSGLKFRSGLGHMCGFRRLAPKPGWSSPTLVPVGWASQNVGAWPLLPASPPRPRAKASRRPERPLGGGRDARPTQRNRGSLEPLHHVNSGPWEVRAKVFGLPSC